MATESELRRVCLVLPGAYEQSSYNGTPSFRTRARAFARIAPLHVMPLPFPSPQLVTAMLWHRRLDDVPAHRWLRSLVLRVARLS